MVQSVRENSALAADEQRPSRASQRLLVAAPVALALTSSLSLITGAHRYFMRPTAALLHRPDEGYATALARRLLDGHSLPYVDGVSHRGPLYYWSIELAMKVFGTGTWMPVRALALLASVLTVAFGFGAAVVSGRATSGAVMALACTAVWVADMQPLDGLGYNSEQLLCTFAMLALLLMSVGLRSVERGREECGAVCIGFSGMATSMAILSKQVGFVVTFTLMVWLGLSRLGAAPARKARVRLFLSFGAGAALPAALVTGVYAAAQQLGTFWYYLVTYNTRVYGAAVQGEVRVRYLHDAFLGRYDMVLLAAPVIGLTAFWFFKRLARRRVRRAPLDVRCGFDLTVALGFVSTLAVSNAALRDFHHYYLIVIPWAALLGGILLEHAAAPRTALRPLQLLAMRTCFLVPMFLVARYGWVCRVQSYAKDIIIQDGFHTQSWPICDFLKRRTSETDSIFMWGFNAAPYTACNRRPASRYVITTFVAGYVPWVEAPREVEAARAAPHSLDILLGELKREMPAVIFDSAGSMAGRSLLEQATLKQFVEANYCLVPVDFGVPTWERKRGGVCPS